MNFLMFLWIILSIWMLMVKYNAAVMLTILIIMVTIASIILFMISCTPWKSIMLFMSFVGGLMILFMFIVSTAPKQETSVNVKTALPILLSLPLISSNIQIHSGSDNTNMFFFSPSIGVLVILLFLNIFLIYASKILNNPIRPFKSSI